MKPAIDDVFIKKDMAILILIPLAIIALFSIRAIFEFSYEYLIGAAGSRIINDFRNIAVYARTEPQRIILHKKSYRGTDVACN